MLTDVLYVPTLQRNLFSISSVAFKNVDTLYTKTGCQMLSDGLVLMEGSLEGMLYKLHIRALTPSPQAHVIHSLGTSSKIDATRSLATWHKRLCHLNYPMILTMDRTAAVTGMILQNKRIPEFCQGCTLGKSHRHNFISHPVRTTASTAGYLVHADLCGPMAHASLGGALYYILFKDDYYGFRYIFFIAAKSKALRYFQEVYHDIFHDTGNHMQIFRADGGGEFKINHIFLSSVFDMRLQHHTLPSRMVFVNMTIAQSWKVCVLSYTPVVFPSIFGLRLVIPSFTPSIALALD